MAETFRIINIDVNKPEQTALVYSLSNNTRVNLGSATLGDQLPLVLRFVNNGAYDDLNGDVGQTWICAVGDLGGTLYAQQTAWYPSSSYGLTGSLNLSTNSLTASLAGNDNITTYFQVKGTDTATGKQKTYLQVPFTIWNSVSTSSISPVSASEYYTKDESDARYLTQQGTASAFVQGGNSFGSTAIIGTLDANALSFYVSGAADRIRIDTNGNVGIGKTGASHKLDVAGGISATYVSAAFASATGNVTFLTASVASVENLYPTEANVTRLTASNANLTKVTASNALFTQANSTGFTSSINSPLVTATDGNYTRFTASNALVTNLTSTRITSSGDITFIGTVANTLTKIVGNKISSSLVYEDGNNNIGIGTATPSGLSDAKLVVWRDTVNQGGSTSVGAESLLRTNSTGSTTVENIAHRAIYQAQTTAGDYQSRVIGLRAEATSNVNGAKFSEAIAVHARPRSVTISTVTASYGVLVERSWAASTITNDYGVYVATPALGTYTNRYGFYAQDPAAKNVLSGSLQVGGIAQLGNEKIITPSLVVTGNTGLGLSQSLSTGLNVTSSTTARSHVRLNVGETPSSPVNGDVWNDNTTGLWLRETGASLHIPGVIQRQTATVSRNSATGGAQTLLSPSLSFPVNFWKVGQVVHLKAFGYLSVASPPTHSLQVKLSITGAAEVTLLDFGAQVMNIDVTNGAWYVDAYVTCRSVGASGTLVADGRFEYYTGSRIVVTNSTEGVVSFNSTSTQDLLFTVTMAGGDSSDKFECQTAIVEVL